MPHPVVHFEIMGRDVERLVEFYRAAFGWEITPLPGGYALVETDAHEHDDEGGMTYTGADAFMNDGVEVAQDEAGAPTWRFAAEPPETVRYFTRGPGGGIAQEDAARVSVSIQVPDLDAALARIEECGGRRVTEPLEAAPDLWVAEFADPEGNVLGLVRG